jgi:phage terminase Nu1 subunit (DNA packaging protein)
MSAEQEGKKDKRGITSAALAAMLEIRLDDLPKLEKAGALVQHPGGGWDVAQSVRGYIRHSRENISLDVIASAVCGPGALASLWGVEQQSVHIKEREGIAVKSGRGVYLLAQSTRNYLEKLRTSAAGKAGSGGGDALYNAKVELTTAQAAEVRMRLQILEGDYIHKDVIGETLSRMFSELRARVLQLPSQARLRYGFDADAGRKLDLLARETLVALADEVIPAVVAGEKPAAPVVEPKRRGRPRKVKAEGAKAREGVA